MYINSRKYNYINRVKMERMTAAVIIFPVFSQADRKGVKPCAVCLFFIKPQKLFTYSVWCRATCPNSQSPLLLLSFSVLLSAWKPPKNSKDFYVHLRTLACTLSVHWGIVEKNNPSVCTLWRTLTLYPECSGHAAEAQCGCKRPRQELADAAPCCREQQGSALRRGFGPAA